ncbi:MAG: iron ABC transporter permease, partial [Anaerolineales bacterium]|nr:iron ABC transporter permease [Anaerolineales bacterium]
MQRLIHRGSKLAFLLPVGFFLLFYFYPLLSILGLSLAPDNQLDLSPLSKLFDSFYYLKVFWFTTWQAFLSTLLVLLFAIPGAYVFTHYRFRGKSSMKAISTLPFVLPTVVVANAFLALLGPGGLLNQWLMALFNLSQPPIQIDHTLSMILLANIFYNYSVALRIISTQWQNLGGDLNQAAQMLGASPRRAFWTVTLPLLRPSVMAAAVLVFLFCFTSFGVILILGGPQFATLEVEIYRQSVQMFNLPVAAALSIVQIGFTFILMWYYTRIQAQTSHPVKLKSQLAAQKPIRTFKDKFIVYGNLTFMFLLLGLPLLALVARSFAGRDGLTLRFYQELFVNRQNSLFFVPPAEAIFNSTIFALATVLLAVSLGLLSVLLLTNGERDATKKSSKRWTRWLDPLFMLPLATSAVTLGFGFIIALDKPPLNLRSSIILVPIAHTLVAIPFVIRSLMPSVRGINPRLREAAAILGANPQQVWLQVDWPLIRRALLVGAVFAFTISMGEFGATLFIARPQTPTMPVA